MFIRLCLVFKLLNTLVLLCLPAQIITVVDFSKKVRPDLIHWSEINFKA